MVSRDWSGKAVAWESPRALCSPIRSVAIATGTTSVPPFAESEPARTMKWVTPHTFRKTVATLLDSKAASARMIADQLGHLRISMTQDVSMGRRAVSPDLAAALESMDVDQRPRPRHAGER